MAQVKGGAYLFPKKNLYNENNNIMKQEKKIDAWGREFLAFTGVKTEADMQVALCMMFDYNMPRKIYDLKLTNDTLSYRRTIDREQECCKIELKYPIIKDITLKDTILCETSIWCGELENVVLDNCCFKGIKMKGCKFKNVIFRNCLLVDFELECSHIYSIDFGNSTLLNFSLSEDILKRKAEAINFKGTKIYRAEFCLTYVSKHQFTKEQLLRVDIDDCAQEESNR